MKVLACTLLLMVGAAQEPAPKPRVLLFGDITFQGHHRGATQALGEAAEVVTSPLGHLSTGAALARLDELLGEGPWDVVVLNCGLSDLMTRDPRSKALRAMSPAAGGVPVTPLDEYGERLDELVEALRARGARLVWTTTLPLSGRNRSHAVRAEDVERYRAVALARMAAHGVAVIDTHQAIVDVLATEPNPRAVDRLHNDTLKSDLSGPLVARLRELLGE